MRTLSLTPEQWARIVECPPFADSISEGDIAWLKEVGDVVALDETVGEVETDKTSLPVNAPAAGTVTKVSVQYALSNELKYFKLLVEDGETVTPGTALFEMEEGDAPAATPAQVVKKEEAAPAPAAAAPVAASAVPTQAPKAAPVPVAPIKATKTADFSAPELRVFDFFLNIATVRT